MIAAFALYLMVYVVKIQKHLRYPILTAKTAKVCIHS